ncbi:hypothetical protein CLPUN_05060 [Clostridium puniceum]|uniref:Uncharacterized protein n=1 Tax=Clostridium puniceum TaxID=29367 RepID=A0A1S8TWJ2_9CLOT|nr:hypothetical protein [Clostridium puniceum]OOM82127.1 hypothetical protein CLPUN_05060 [Clostridium puniceum]
MINKDLEKKLKKNMEFSEKLCEVLNNYVKNDSITYSAIVSNEDIGVRQILDTRGLHYNDMFFKDEIINKCSLAQIIEFVWLNLGRGEYCSVVPTPEEISIYDKLKDNDWLNEDIWINEGSLYINNEEFYIEDIEKIKIDKDIIELQFQDENEKWCKVSVKRGLKVEMEEIKKNKMIPFNIIFNDEEEEQFVRDIKILNSANKIEQAQVKAVNNIENKYKNMGKDVQDIFKVINKDAETLAKSSIKMDVGGGSNSNKNTKDSLLGGIFSGDKTENVLGGILSGNLTRILGSLSIVGAGLTGVKKILDTINGWTQQGFNAINSLSGNLLSYQGLKEGLQSAGQFETNRVAMDVLYGNNPVIGQKYYAMGTKLAKDTPYSEREVGELQKKLAGAKVNYKKEDLMTLLDIASIKPELGASHVGFSIVDAMGGRSTSLKTNYMLDNKEINKYLQSLSKSKNIEDRANSKKWKDAFNKTGTVNNKQEYLDLLIDYVKHETKYSGLTERYSKTMNGLMDRIQGNWETVLADLLGVDANNTGMAKNGINVFNSVKKFLDYMDNWLSSSNASIMFDKLGTGLGKAVDSVAKAIENFIDKIKWNEVGSVLEKMGDSVAKIVNTLASSPAFVKLLDTLPDMLERILNSKAIELVTTANQTKDVANKNPFAAVVDGGYGWWIKSMNNSGVLSPKEASNVISSSNDNSLGFSDNISKNFSELGMYLHNGVTYGIATGAWDSHYLTDANASTYLAQNPNLDDNQRNQIKDIMNNDNKTIYNVSISEVKTDSAEDLILQIQNLQNNQK